MWHICGTCAARSAKDFDTTTPGLTPHGAAVPSSVDAVPPGILGRRGVAMYRRSFQQKGRARLQFMGCSFYCRVFVDGKEVGEHRAGGFVPWWLDLESPSPSEITRELFVLADNRFNRTTAPLHTGGDFWHYGGLVRSVLLHDLPDDPREAWVWRAHVIPKASEYSKGYPSGQARQNCDESCVSKSSFDCWGWWTAYFENFGVGKWRIWLPQWRSIVGHWLQYQCKNNQSCLYPGEKVALLELPIFEPNLVRNFFSASHHTQQVDINVTLTSNFSGPISRGIAFDDFKEEIFNVTAKDGKFSIHVRPHFSGPYLVI